MAKNSFQLHGIKGTEFIANLPPSIFLLTLLFLANLLRKALTRSDEVGSLLRAIYCVEVDLVPDHEQGTLTIRLHHLANRNYDQAILKLCDELKTT